MRTLPALALVVLANSAWAGDSRIEFLSRQMDRATDPRARAQAALLLGASNDVAAIAPLCGGLNDNADIVRSSSAKALSQLADPSATDCLKRHANDRSAEVRDTIQRTLAMLESQSRPKGLGSVYVALSPVADKQNSPNAALARLADERLRAALTAMGVTVAPPNEGRAAATEVIRARRLKGFLLTPELHTHPPAGLRLTLLCLTYPDKSILGEVSVKASGAGAQDLIRALAPKVIEEAADTFDWSR